ncbi:MAG: hypothetical protein R3A79_20060 [Nannocystaceae bacterium]
MLLVLAIASACGDDDDDDAPAAAERGAAATPTDDGDAPQLDLSAGAYVLVKPGTTLYREPTLETPAFSTGVAPTWFARRAASEGSIELRTGQAAGARDGHCFAGQPGLDAVALTVYVAPGRLESVTTATIRHAVDDELLLEIGPGARVREDGEVEVGDLRFTPAEPAPAGLAYTLSETPSEGLRLGVDAALLADKGALLGDGPIRRGKRRAPMRVFEAGALEDDAATGFFRCVKATLTPAPGALAKLTAKLRSPKAKPPPSAAEGLQPGTPTYWEDGPAAGQLLQPWAPLALKVEAKQIDDRDCYLFGPSSGVAGLPELTEPAATTTKKKKKKKKKKRRKKTVEEEPEVVPPTMTSAHSRGIWLCFDRPET